MGKSNFQLKIKLMKMKSRRNFMWKAGIVGLSTTVDPFSLLGNITSEYISNRPAVKDRKFVSIGVEKVIKQFKAEVQDKELGWLFENCFPNTLDTTVEYEIINGRPDTYVITGDIDAMWLRDSSAQVWPYLHLMKDDEPLQTLIE